LRLLIDECLSPALVGTAHAVGHEAYHIAHMGLASAKDWSVPSRAVDQGFILVTNNGADFRGLYSRFSVHPGLLIIIPSADRETQIGLFKALLAKLAEIGEPINQVIEAHLDGENVRFELYSWPPE
jgi:predicted nuclease of predicted toxin-antitoxin system